MKAVTDLRQALDAFAREVRDGVQSVRSDVQSVRSDIQSVRSDVATLENQNFSRHCELLNVMRRLDEFGFPADGELT